ncbi:hypothetical protein [Halocola ammonii]
MENKIVGNKIKITPWSEWYHLALIGFFISWLLYYSERIVGYLKVPIILAFNFLLFVFCAKWVEISDEGIIVKKIYSKGYVVKYSEIKKIKLDKPPKYEHNYAFCISLFRKNRYFSVRNANTVRDILKILAKQKVNVEFGDSGSVAPLKEYYFKQCSMNGESTNM